MENNAWNIINTSTLEQAKDIWPLLKLLLKRRLAFDIADFLFPKVVHLEVSTDKWTIIFRLKYKTRLNKKNRNHVVITI